MSLSIVEFVVYAIICYSGIVMLIISAFQNTTTTKSGSGARVIWIIPSMFAAFILMSLGGGIIFDDGGVTTITTQNLNTTETFTETRTAPATVVTLVSPIWGTVHFLFFIILLLYVLFNLVGLFIKHD